MFAAGCDDARRCPAAGGRRHQDVVAVDRDGAGVVVADSVEAVVLLGAQMCRGGCPAAPPTLMAVVPPSGPTCSCAVAPSQAP